MAPIGTIVQDAIQVLSSPAWTGIGVIVSSIISTIALILSLPILKKVEHIENS